MTAGLGEAVPVHATAIQPHLSDITFYGRGYGHGVGMSQYGARGRAIAGQKAPEILAHYYAGTTIGTRNDAATIRVLLLANFAASATKRLTVVGKSGTWTIDGIAKAFPADAKLTLAPVAAGSTSWVLRVRSAAGTLLHTATVTGDVWVRPSAPSVLLQLISKSSTKNIYRGVLRIRLRTTATVVNHLAVRTYLRGVVPAEMPSSWPAEALKVQAIAARSYAIKHLHPTTGSYDIYDDTRSQVYRGRLGEAAATNAAIRATAGLVVLSGTTVANTLFHSAAGGATENNEYVWVSATGMVTGSPVSYLRGSGDRAPDGTPYDAASPYVTWKTATYPLATLSNMFATDARTNVGALASIDLSVRGVSGRLIRVTLTGALGTKSVSGDVFRSVFNAARPAADPMLRSTLFDVAPIP